MNLQNEKAEPSYASGAGTIPLLGCCIGEALDATVRTHPNYLALISRHQNLRFTFTEWHTGVERFARGLMHLGVLKGDRVGIWATNCSEWVIAQLATAKLGAILVNVNPAYRAYELKFALAQSECQTLIMVPDFNDADFVSILVETCPELSPTVKCSWLVKQKPTVEISFTRPWRMSDCLEASARLIATGTGSLYRGVLRRSCIGAISGMLRQDLYRPGYNTDL